MTALASWALIGLLGIAAWLSALAAAGATGSADTHHRPDHE